MNLRQGLVWGLGALALAGAVVWALWPEPLVVDLGEVTTGPMRGSVSLPRRSRAAAPPPLTLRPPPSVSTSSRCTLFPRSTRMPSMVPIHRPSLLSSKAVTNPPGKSFPASICTPLSVMRTTPRWVPAQIPLPSRALDITRTLPATRPSAVP